MGQWAPTSIIEIYEVVHSSTRPLHVETDMGPAFVKLVDSDSGPHALACDWVGTQLAAWLGAPTFDLHVFHHAKFTLDDVVGGKRKLRQGVGPSLASRKVVGQTWGGDAEQLDAADNPEVASDLVVLDTWTRNNDRFHMRGSETRMNYRNVFFSEEDAAPGRLRLIAMDFTECIKSGRAELDRQCFTVDRVKDAQLFGLFPEFKRLIASERVVQLAEKLETFTRPVASEILRNIPREWSIDEELRGRVADFLYERSAFLAPILKKMIGDACGW